MINDQSSLWNIHPSVLSFWISLRENPWKSHRKPIENPDFFPWLAPFLPEASARSAGPDFRPTPGLRFGLLEPGSR